MTLIEMMSQLHSHTDKQSTITFLISMKEVTRQHKVAKQWDSILNKWVYLISDLSHTEFYTEDQIGSAIADIPSIGLSFGRIPYEIEQISNETFERIHNVFIDGVPQLGSILLSDLNLMENMYKASAEIVLKESGADHVVYCSIEYKDDDSVKVARFYNGLKFSDAEFYKSIDELEGNPFIGAVHRRG